MIKFLKSLFGCDVPDTPVIAQEQPKEPAKPKKQAKKPATKKAPTKKSAKTDLSGLSKNDLLAHAKKNGIKANASMKKADILAAINNG